ncbi:MAG: hypothetical protein ACJAR4_001793 [Psychroserpens sp.]|jgi:hypothetical protein
MSFDLEALKLAETYDFSVTVIDGKNNFAAKLYLSPEKITITIMGEENEERNCTLGWDDLERLICHDGNKTFFLHDLSFIKGQNSLISHHPKHIGFFEKVFEVGYVIFSPSHLYEGDLVKSISIHSNKISEWVGNTNKQEDIIKAYSNRERIFDNPDKFNEFSTPLEGIGILGVGYNLSRYSSSPDFSVGIEFPPSLIIEFINPQLTNEVMNSFLKLYALLAFFIGNDFLIEQINTPFSSLAYDNEGTLYYPSKSINPKYNQSYSLFPLGKDVRFDSLGLPSLPITSFNNYYSLSEVLCGYFLKYLKYKRMENPEERFLGYFRILESLCSNKKNYLDEKLLEEVCQKAKSYLIRKFDDKMNVTKFLNGISRYNNSKYNTEKCIQDFYLRIPNSISAKWKVEKRDIGDICKFRNDITHANDYNIRTSQIEEKVKFIEVLLVYSLFEKLGVELPMAAKILYRISGYHLITKN